MALGSVLLQPQTLERMRTLDANQALADDIIALLQQILLNPDHLASVGPAFDRAFDALAQRLRVRLEPRLDRALDELRALFDPATQAAQQVVAQGQNMDSASKMLELIAAVLEKLIAAVQAVSEPQLRDFARRIHSILSDTLGLNQTVLKEEVREVVRSVRQELLVGVGTMDARSASVHLALAALIGRMEQELFDQWPTLDLNPDRVAQGALQALQRSGFEKVRAELACILEKVRAALAAGGALIDLAKPGAFHSVGAQARAPLSGDTYCWYASWLYASRRRTIHDLEWWLGLLPGFPDDEVWLSEDRTQLILRRALADDEVLHEDPNGNLHWYDAPQFTSTASPECFAFGVAGPKFMETWTQLFATLVEFVKGGLHVISFATSPKEYGSNIPLWLWNWTKSVVMALGGVPLPSLLTNRARAGIGTEWLYVLVPLLSVLVGSIEGRHTKANSENRRHLWATLLAGDVLSAFTIHSVPTTVHEALLSFLTLINQQGPAGAPDGEDTRPRTREQGDPLVGLMTTGANYLMMKCVLPRENYAYPFKDSKFCLWWLLGGSMAGLSGGLVGTLLVWTFSRTYDWGQLGKALLAQAGRSVAFFMVTQYALMEGDTDDGKYNPKLDEAGKPYSPPRQPFKGYPPAATSPYKLPYEQGASKFVNQGNQGMFSHMRFNSVPQVYAYDFAHDFGDEVLAARDGTVVDFFDWIEDNTEPDGAAQTAALNASVAVMGPNWRSDAESWNFIVVRHDTAVSDHDQDVNGTPTTTYAVYGHGKKQSIRDAFAAKGVAATAILGTKVKQGEVIMQADDTGFSYHSHLHMHVRGGPTPPATPPATPKPIDDASLTQYTLPFVFRDAKNVFGRDGVLKKLTWYKSDNVKV